MICIPITAGSIDDVISEMSLASGYADIIELRLDYISGIENAGACLEKALSIKTRPVIVTNRSKGEGGKF